MTTYTIRMKNCAFFARHGVLDEEEALGQRFYVDAELTVEPAASLEADSIDSTVDYGVAFGVIEALALEVAKALAARFPEVRKASITVRKPNAPVRGVLDYVEVNVVWPQ